MATNIENETNVLLRYLLEPVDQHNPHWQAIAAKQVIAKANVDLSDCLIARRANSEVRAHSILLKVRNSQVFG
jgi:hypothetical protein